ncbi:zinc metallopeptidase [Aquibium carbonis]|uniref:Zinc metallopeptidase n=1 Tax=Aquibium carbonis TaxID=2495581 RepID=A0A429YTZ9_9HYPH|nr:zinc metallopeptidase [Aquibium carbonis]RST84814.1 zinc metallopeptidase [Aquibium carbonis]
MIAIIVAVLVLAVVTLPQLLVRTTINRHAADRPDLPGTGGELARHLLDRFDLGHVKVEVTDKGDHYDPDAAAVRLLPQHHGGRSLSAVAIAAHEVAHAIQHGNGERKLALRQRLARLAMFTDRIAGIFFIAAPILTVIIRSPVALAGAIGLGVGLLSVRVVVNLVTLPVETDASFAKALPILREGGYLSEGDLPAARSVLRAAAFTYVAGALISLINLARWIRLLR